MECEQIRPLLETFADGELNPGQILLVEGHVETCSQCADELSLTRALRTSTQRAVTSATRVSGDFEARVRAALLEEEQRAEAADVSDSRVAAWRGVIPTLAAAAGALLWMNIQGQLTDDSKKDGELEASVGPEVVVPETIERALDRLIDHHSSPPQPLVTQADMLPSFEPNVGVRIRLPQLDAYGARWEGASLVPMINYQAASLRYEMPGHRVTVYVFDPSKMRIHKPLKRRVVADQPIYVGDWRGYSVAVKDNRGVGYAMTADLDNGELAQLITSIH